MKRAALVAALLALAACEQEKREFEKPLLKPDARLQAQAQPEQQPGQAGEGLRAVGSAGKYNEVNAFEVSQGKTWYRWYNCAGCHAQGGGAIGPALMDDRWIYGKEPDAIFSTIMDGRPNGMPAFRGRIPEAQAWQLVAYVRSMSGLLSVAAEPSGHEGLLGGPPETLRDPQPPDRK